MTLKYYAENCEKTNAWLRKNAPDYVIKTIEIITASINRVIEDQKAYELKLKKLKRDKIMSSFTTKKAKFNLIVEINSEFVNELNEKELDNMATRISAEISSNEKIIAALNNSNIANFKSIFAYTDLDYLVPDFNKPKNQKTDYHTEHCCAYHGCKYNNNSCTVVTGKLIQSFSCGYTCTCPEDIYGEH